MNPKILFTDLDGTLLNKEKQISPSLRKGLQDMLSNGHKLVLASGRPFDSIVEVKEQLNLDNKGIYISAFNGSTLYDCETETMLQDESIPYADALKIIDIAMTKKLHIHTYTHTMNASILSPLQTKELDHYTKHIHRPTIIQNPVSQVLHNDVPKLLVIDLENKEHLFDFQCTIATQMPPYITTVFSSEFYLEVISANAGKGKSVDFLCNHLNVPYQNSYSVGDAENDLSMLQAAGTGCAMANATDLVKSKADHILTKSNTEDGVLELLQTFEFL